MEESPLLILARLLGVIVLVLLNGFFVSAEFALVSIRRTRVEELVAQGNTAAEAVRHAILEPDRFIAATQLGITLASLGLGWMGEPAFAVLLEPVLRLLPESLIGPALHSLAGAIAFAIITFLHVVVGELAPKSIALQRTEETALTVARPTIWAERIFKPAIWALNGTGNALLRLFGLEPASGHEMVHSVEEIKMLVEASAHGGVIENAEYEMLDAIFDLRGMLVRQVMVPRTDVVMIEADATLRDLVALHEKHPRVRFPVYEGDADHIVGILHLREVVQRLAAGELDTPVRELAREGLFVPETIRVGGLLSEFREHRQHIAIVLDEYGGTAGLITLEDVLEEIAGDVPDEFEDVVSEITPAPDGSALVDGRTAIEDVNDFFGLHLSDPNYDTIAGYVMGLLERIPQVGDEVAVGNVRFRVEAMSGLRVGRLRVTTAPKEAQ
jgi:CBS domain containing-hemolysin-like protein